jgi:hypothetical protein
MNFDVISTRETRVTTIIGLIHTVAAMHRLAQVSGISFPKLATARELELSESCYSYCEQPIEVN